MRERIGKIACTLYGLESMIYLTTGIIDQYDNPKVDLECVVTKAYSQDILRNIADFALNLMKSPATVAGHEVGVDVRDAMQLQCDETNGALKNHAGRIGLQHAMVRVLNILISDDLFYTRFFFCVVVFQEHFGHYARDYKDSVWLQFGLANPTIEFIEPKLDLWYHLHPTFKELAEDLEFSILRLRYASEMLLTRYDSSVGERQNDIKHLGEAAMWNYAMFASIGRASRAYCIGLRYSAYETILADSLFIMGTENNLQTALNIKHQRNEYSEEHKEIFDFISTHR